MSALGEAPVDPTLAAFWDLFDALVVQIPARPGLNLADDPSLIAFNLPHLEQIAHHHKRTLPASIPELQILLKQSTAPRFLRNGLFNCHDGRIRNCWAFKLWD